MLIGLVQLPGRWDNARNRSHCWPNDKFELLENAMGVGLPSALALKHLTTSWLEALMT
jgi:hypothetical protein